MNPESVIADYLRKVRIRRKALDLFFDEASYDDVIREAQELVELVLKGVLRHIGIEPPKHHDVGSLLVKHRDRFPRSLHPQLPKIETISKALFEERGHAFYGEESSLMPASELFDATDAKEALQWTDKLISFFEEVMKNTNDPSSSPKA